ncbi:MAG: hypothetical protein AAGG08_00015 [Actinomycetota bacterium]
MTSGARRLIGAVVLVVTIGAAPLTEASADRIDQSGRAVDAAERIDEPLTGSDPLCELSYTLRQPSGPSTAATRELNLIEFERGSANAAATVTELQFVPTDTRQTADFLVNTTFALQSAQCTTVIAPITGTTNEFAVADIGLGSFFAVDVGFDTSALDIAPTLWGFAVLTETPTSTDIFLISDQSFLVSFPRRPAAEFVALSADARSIAYRVGDMLEIYENQTVGTEPALRIPVSPASDVRVLQAEFSPSGQRLVLADQLPRLADVRSTDSGASDQLTIVDIVTGRTTTLTGVPMWAFGFDDDHTLYACGSALIRFDGQRIEVIRRRVTDGLMRPGRTLDEVICNNH